MAEPTDQAYMEPPVDQNHVQRHRRFNATTWFCWMLQRRLETVCMRAPINAKLTIRPKGIEAAECAKLELCTKHPAGLGQQHEAVGCALWYLGRL